MDTVFWVEEVLLLTMSGSRGTSQLGVGLFLFQLELRSADTPVTIPKKVVGGLSLLRQHTIPSAQQASLMGGRHQDFKVFLIDITEEKWIGGVPCASVG